MYVMRARICIIKDFCKGCGLCVAFCSRGVLVLGEEVNKKGYRYVKVKDASKCILCRVCEYICHDFAIYIKVLGR